MAQRRMKKLFKLGNKTFYWANEDFMYQGLWVWNGTNNVRIVPFNRFKKWTGEQE